MITPIPHNEDARLAALDTYKILDTASEPEYDNIAQLAAKICNTRMSNVAFIDKDRKWYKAKFGTESEFAPRAISICSHTILGSEPLIINDTLEDPVFRNIGMVTKPPHVRFYAGFPLININGFALGTLCVIDTEPKELDETQLSTLKVLTNHLTTLLELRRDSARLRIALKEKSDAFEKINQLTGILPICSYCKSIRDDDEYWHQVDEFLATHTDASFTHGCCPSCLEKIKNESRT